MNLEWTGHAGFKINGKKTVYIDPFQITSSEKADLILITHPHYDHCSIADLKKIVGANTVIVAPIDCQSKIASGKMKFKQFHQAKPGDKLHIYEIGIEAVPAYNIGKPYHNQNDDWVGYVISMEGKRIYHAGDSDYLNEMAGIKSDIALLPVGGTYTMNAREAAHAASIMKPKVTIPMHYGSVIGTKEDALALKSSYHGRVEIMQINTPEELV